MRRPGRGGTSVAARVVAVLLLVGLVATVSPWLVRTGYRLLTGLFEVVL